MAFTIFLTQLTLSYIFLVVDYFLEDAVQMLDFFPPPSEKKRRDDDEVDEGEDEKTAREVGLSWFG